MPAQVGPPRGDRSRTGVDRDGDQIIELERTGQRNRVRGSNEHENANERQRGAGGHRSGHPITAGY